MPDTFFTASPHWAWYIVFYFFIGGIAGGAFFIAALLDRFGRAEDRPVVRVGYYLGCSGAVVSGLLLTLDLRRPERFWHMLIQANTGAPMFSPWSPMSVGAWGLLLFGGCAFLATLGGLAEEGRVRWTPLLVLRRPVPATAIAGLGSLLGFFLAGYTGVLLSVTNRPMWADTSWLGALFLISAGSTGAAALVLVGLLRGDAHQGSLVWLSRFDRAALWLELAVLGVFVASLGTVARALLGWWGLLLLLGVAGAGIVLPLAREARPRAHQRGALAATMALVLLGGLLLRMIVVLSSESIHVAGAGVVGR